MLWHTFSTIVSSRWCDASLFLDISIPFHFLSFIIFFIRIYLILSYLFRISFICCLWTRYCSILKFLAIFTLLKIYFIHLCFFIFNFCFCSYHLFFKSMYAKRNHLQYCFGDRRKIISTIFWNCFDLATSCFFFFRYCIMK